MARVTDPSSGDPARRNERVQNIITFWNALSVRGDSGETSWGVLDDIGSEVTSCLAREPQDLKRAEWLTVKAAMLMAGEVFF